MNYIDAVALKSTQIMHLSMEISTPPPPPLGPGQTGDTRDMKALLNEKAPGLLHLGVGDGPEKTQ